MRYVICHYHEVGLKGVNRWFFEEKLAENIERALQPSWYEAVERIQGRILLTLTAEGEQAWGDVRSRIRWVFGVANYARATRVAARIQNIETEAVELLQQAQPATFKVDTRRSDKSFELTSMQTEERVGATIQRHVSPAPEVDLEEPDATLTIEIVGGTAYLYTQKLAGAGGLPVSTGGRAVSLLSGGIDSPVASFFVAKRGVEVVLLHCHAYPYTQRASLEKAERVAERFAAFQPRVTLYLVPFADLQREIVLNTKPALRMILYRRAMARIAQSVAEQEKAGAVVTGESIGQVASQTLGNIGVVDENVSLPVLRPLIGMDKEEIIWQAKHIGTYDISIQPAEDCCTRFLPKHPETRADRAVVEQEEQKFAGEHLIADAVANADIVVYDGQKRVYAG